MNKIITLLTLILASVSIAFAQSSREEIMADINRAGGIYYGYTVPTADYTPAPKGYEPFYISHYGRHGSRYILKEVNYAAPLKILNDAHAAGKLTPLGEDVRERVSKIFAVAHNRGGELTQRGTRQHEEIATRMAGNFPEIFKQKDVKVDVLSSVIPRCLVSMSAFCDALKGCYPSIKISRDASVSKMVQIHYYKDIWNEEYPIEMLNIVEHPDSYWRKQMNKNRDERIDYSRLLNIIFNDKEYLRTEVAGTQFWLYLAELAGNMQCLDIEGVSFFDLFTADELYEFWRANNFSAYAKYGKYIYYPLSANIAKHTLNAIVEQIDKDIAAGTPNVSLRFGHDTCLFAITPIMGIPGCDAASTDYETISEIWRNYTVTPMAANLQMIFYRKKGSDEVLVRIMLNEQEISLNIESNTAPYYRWSDVKQYWANNIKKVNY